jgi:excisionase family DNA binding protein
MIEISYVELPNPEEVPAHKIPPLMAQLAAFQGALAVRLLRSGVGPETADGDRLLTIDEASSKLQASKDWLYRHGKKLPFAVRVGRHLRFSERGIENYIRQRAGRQIPNI